MADSNDDRRINISVPLKTFERFAYWLLIAALGGWHGMNIMSTRGNAGMTPAAAGDDARIQALEIFKAEQGIEMKNLKEGVDDLAKTVKEMDRKLDQFLIPRRPLTGESPNRRG